MDCITAFETSQQQLLAELERIDLLIRARVAHLRQQHAADEHFRGLYISEQEVDGLLAQPNGRPTWLRGKDNDWLSSVDERLAARAGNADAARGERSPPGAPTRLQRLRDVFGLTRFEIDTLLVCLAGELDLRYEKLYAYLQDDVTRRRPSVELVIHLLTTTDAERLSARRSFQRNAPLLTHQLAHLLEDPAQSRPPLLAQYVKIDDRIVRYLLDDDDHGEVDDCLRHAVEVAAAGGNLDSLMLDEDTRQTLRRAWSPAARAAAPVLVLRGPPGAGKRSVAQALCHERQMPLLRVDCAALSAAPETSAAHGARQELRDKVALVHREALLRGAGLYWYGHEPLTADAERLQIALIWRMIDRSMTPCIVGANEPFDTPDLFRSRGAIAINLPDATHGQRHAQWAAGLAGLALAPEVDLDAIAARFKLTLGQIKRAAATAGHLAQAHGGSVTQQQLLEACRLHSNQRLRILAQKIPAHDRWDDIVLPPDRVAQLREICNQVKFRERVYGDWGFGRKLALGKGLTVLFSGPSGTGKTMAAGIVAGELGLDLYKIDLSTVVSKYIGETEKNLRRIFDEAETSNAVLFFDEADALFGKRSEVRDSHDRYANIEVGFLLQRMEEYQGVAILATNFRKNMDEAFVRRLHFAVEFPFPDAPYRHRIWQGIWPRDTPRADDLDLQWLAQRYEMSGGNIKNIAVAAAFLAADDGGRVTLKHVVRSVHREYQKAGKLMYENDEVAPEDGLA